MTARADDGCLVCGHDHTCNGFICADCYRLRVNTRHWRWLDLDYLSAVRAELDGPITTASAARFAPRQAQGRR